MAPSRKQHHEAGSLEGRFPGVVGLGSALLQATKASSAMAALSRSRPSPWARCAALAGLALSICGLPVSTGLEVLETVVDRDGDVLVVEDILEGFGRVPVSVAFSPTSSHMFIGFKAGEVRIYPDGGDTLVAAIYDSCVDMEPDVSFRFCWAC